METNISSEIDAPADLVWQVMSDVEGWPIWTASVTSVRLLDPGPLRVGSRAEIRQPKLPKAVWTVSTLEPGRSFTWTTVGPGILGVGTHTVTELASTDGSAHSRATLSLVQSKPLGELTGRLFRGLTVRYLNLEINGLRRRSEELASGRGI